MKIKIIAISLILTINNSFAQIAPTIPPRGLPPLPVPLSVPDIGKEAFNMDFQNITISNLLQIIFSEINNKSYVLGSKVLADQRVISFRYDKKKNGDLDSFLTSFLLPLGYKINKQNSIYFIDEIPEKKAEDFDYFVYFPKYRTANYLVDNLRPYFPENFSSQIRQIPAQEGQKINTEELSSTNPLNAVDKEQENISFKYENEKIKKKILDFIKQLDTPEINLIVKSYVYEVQYTEKDGSALGAMLNLANDKFKINLGSANPLDNMVKFSSNTLSLFVSSISNNSNVNLISNTVLRIKNKKESIFTVGNSVPTLGNVSYTNQGQPIQNVEYKDTGLVLKLNPTITQESISLNLVQEISEAINTSTGVNNTPTLTKRNLQTTFTTKKNEVVMLAGLTQNKKTNTESKAFILPFFTSNNTEEIKTDIVIFLEILDFSDQ